MSKELMPKFFFMPAFQACFAAMPLMHSENTNDLLIFVE